MVVSFFLVCQFQIVFDNDQSTPVDYEPILQFAWNNKSLGYYLGTNAIGTICVIDPMIQHKSVRIFCFIWVALEL